MTRIEPHQNFEKCRSKRLSLNLIGWRIKTKPPERGFSVVGNSLVGKSRCQGLPKATSLLATSVAQSSFTALAT